MPPSPSRLREQRAKACGGSVKEGAHHGDASVMRSHRACDTDTPSKLARTRWLTRGVVPQSEIKDSEAWRHLCRRGEGASFGVRVGAMTAAGRLLSGTAERCSWIFSHPGLIRGHEPDAVWFEIAAMFLAIKGIGTQIMTKWMWGPHPFRHISSQLSILGSSATSVSSDNDLKTARAGGSVSEVFGSSKDPHDF